jgi:S-adenosylmethionine/arginine decarboxylase-like enzyme
VTNHRCGAKVGGTFRADAKLLSSRPTIEKFLKTLVTKLEMYDLTTVMYDVAAELKARGEKIEADEGGLTAVVVLSTSHIALHTWPEESGATFDIHSCREFPVDLVTDIIKDIFVTNDVETFDLSYSLQSQRFISSRIA